MPAETTLVQAEADAATVLQADVDLSFDREIDLAPEDWYRATFRSLIPLVRGEPAAFDKDDCLRRLRKLKTIPQGFEIRWSALNLPVALSAQEAHFWFAAMTELRSIDTTMKAFAETIGKLRLDGKVTVENARRLIATPEGHEPNRRTYAEVPEEATLALANLLSPDEYLELILEGPAAGHAWQRIHTSRLLMYGFNKYVVPYLTEPQKSHGTTERTLPQ